MNKDMQSLLVYGTNFAGSYIPKIGSISNPLGALIFGGIDVAKRLCEGTDNSYVRAVETFGAFGYSLSAVSNILSSLNGNLHSLGSGILDASMAYQLFVNEGVLDNLKRGQTKRDVKKIKTDLESLLNRV